MPGLDTAIAIDAVEDALMYYLARPERFDPAQARLDTFITLAATHRALNAIRAEVRRVRNAQSFAATQPATCEPAIFVTPIDTLNSFVLPNFADTDEERRFLAMRLAGERRTVELATALNLQHLPVVDQCRLVKRLTDKLMVRLRRFGKTRRSPPRSLTRA
jgi:DNA-directed RNA polymerase specialized sigma24 family protein